MARTVKPASMGTRTARARLRRGRQPAWNVLAAKAHLGYQRWPGEKAGRWILRQRIGGSYSTLTIGSADDTIEADGVSVFSYHEARERALELAGGERVAGSTTVDAAIESYLRDLRARGKSTETAATAALYIPRELGATALADLTTRALQMWIANTAAVPARALARRGKPRGVHKTPLDADEAARRRKNSANRIASVLIAALNLAFREGHAPSDAPWKRLKKFRGVDVPRARYLSIDESVRLLNACPADFRRLVRAALSTGCRYGELIAFEVGDLDVDAAAIHVRRSKSGRARHVPLGDEALRFFRSLAAGRGAGERLLTRESGEPWARCNQTRLMREACANARIVPRVGFHALRHTYASHMVMAGAPLPVVAAALGHRDARMTERYAHLSKSYAGRVIRETAPVFGPEPTNVEPLSLNRGEPRKNL